MTSISFRASARTIDHLGKGQIADTPTAVSELWKNSYDAYARNVALHTFDGPIQCAAIIDNGCGMTLSQIINSWLVIGTNSKTKKVALPEVDRFGLNLRMTQGEKGIGRLSAAFLAPVSFLVTKKISGKFSAVLIDWRLFENPYLSLRDINVPYTEFQDISDLKSICSKLLTELKGNLFLDAPLLTEDEIDRKQVILDELEKNETSKYKDIVSRKLEIQASRIRYAWNLLSKDEKEINEDIETTEEQIESFCCEYKFDDRCAHTWKEFLKESELLDGSSHGTGLFLLDVNRELSLLTNRGDRSVDNFELVSIRESLTDTLKAFTDPFDKSAYCFTYEIKAFAEDWAETTLLNDFDEFGYEIFQLLEHRVEGTIDEKGWFKGTVVAWGQDLGELTYPPSISFENGTSKVGKFDIKLGAFEQKGLSTLDDKTNEFVDKRSDGDHGILIFRDGLRVLPYGRTDYDFFDIEARRGTNAGRYFWANRRTFGQISLNQVDNILLKDKAGREGFIKNQAARELKELVIDHLINFADKHFGGKSDERKIRLEIFNKEKTIRKEAQKKANKQTQTSFKESITNKKPKLDEKLIEAKKLYKELEQGLDGSLQKLEQLILLTNDLESIRGELKTPTKPSKLTDKMESSYREYRDLYNEFSELMRVSQEKINHFEVSLSNKSPIKTAKKHFDSKQSLLNKQVSKYEKLVLSKLDKLNIRWQRDASDDRGKFHEEAISILESVSDVDSLESHLNTLESIYINLADNHTVKYESLLRALDRLDNGVNLDAAFSMAEEEKVYFEHKAKQLQSLAQLGISVEVMGHEIEQQDQLVTRGLNSLPSEIRAHPGYKTAYNAHKQLTSQIRFLSPLKLSGYQARQDIDGTMIESHIKQFFRDRFERQRVEFIVSNSFKNIQIRDLPSRIYPVFVNLVNNAMYWVCLSEVRTIKIDVIDGLVVIGNTGPAIDEDDISRLFELFYSRRTNGHGVGLYLCKENLAIAQHKIWYAELADQQLFKTGANFVMEFNGMEYKG